METTTLRHGLTPSPTVWTIQAGDETYRIRTSSARTAIRRVARKGVLDPIIVGLDTEPVERRGNAGREDRLERLETSFLPQAIRRRAAGESVAQIARKLGLPRETLRDWLRRRGL